MRFFENVRGVSWLVAVLLVLFLGITPRWCLAQEPFQQWLRDFCPTALAQGVSQSTYEHAFAGVTAPDQAVLKKAAYQPEFTLKIWDYLDARINPIAIDSGRRMGKKHVPTLALLERRFGIDRTVLLAIWSMETSYGAVLRRTERLHYVPRALATLAWGDSRRQKFARTQLVAALQILQAGDISKEQMLGSWAGAMGHTQFIPTSYLAYGVDMDGNGRRDIWNSIPDALATAANLLAQNGWRSGRTWGYEAIAPQSAGDSIGDTKTLAQWAALGFHRPSGQGFPRPQERAELKMPAGENGPAFLMLKNFFVLKRYNNSDFYALAVGLLADRLAGFGGMVQKWPRPPGTLEADEKFALQRLLQAKGYYDGAIDGQIGAGTRAAIRQYQAAAGLVVDGEPTKAVLETLLR